MDHLFKKKKTLQDLTLQLSSYSFQSNKGFDSLLCLNDLTFEPKYWQTETAQNVLKNMHGNAVLADEVGLGKTIEAGLIIKELMVRNMLQSVLVLVPAPLVEQWKREMKEKFSIDLFDAKDDGWENENFLVCSLPLATRSKERRDVLKEKNFDIVIVDEAHSLKNHRTAAYKFVYSLKRKNTILMSATPIQNDLRELFNLVNILKPGYLKSRRNFREEYMENRFLPKNIAKLKQLLSEVMIRHRRSDTLVELPRRLVHTVEVEMDDVEREFYHRVIEFCQSIYQRYAKGRISLGWDAQQVNIFTLLLVSLLKQNSSSPQSVTKTLEEKILPKLEEDYEKSVCNRLIQLGGTINVPTKARTLLDILKEQDDRSIVYSEYIPTLFMLKKFLESQGMEVILYYGGMNAAEKDAAVKKFRDTEKAIFLSSESGGQGLNLQFCHQLINYDLPWNPMRIEQRIGRVHRFGQTETVDIYMTPVKGTIDDYLLYILTSKINLFELVIGELDTIMSYALDNDYSLEVTIGKIMLESIDSSDMEAKLRQIGEDLLKAKTQYIADTKDSAKLLDEIGADNNE